MIVSAAKVIFFVLTLFMVAVTVAAMRNPEVHWQIKYALLAISLGCIGTITNWRRSQRFRKPEMLDLRLHKENL